MKAPDMLTEGIEQLVSSLEQQELNSPSGITTLEVYSELFAAYLYQNELSHARFLWRRIPQNLKNPELEQMNQIFESLWHNKPAQFYALITFNWSPNVGKIMIELKNRYQQETLNLIGTAYTSIFEDKLTEMVNHSVETVPQLCKSLDWQVVDGLIVPKKPVMDRGAQTACEDQLKKLTEFVSFLES